MTSPQLTLGVRLSDDAQFDNFHGDRNATAAIRLAELCRTRVQPVVLLCGDEDTGKSHLLQAACHQVEHQGDVAVCLSLEELLRFGPDSLDGLEYPSLVGLDDLDLIAGRPDWEEAVFHLYNRVLDRGHSLIISLRETPGSCSLELEDLVSRLQHGMLLQLGIYRDDDRLKILRARAEKRGLLVSDDVATFIMRRAPRKLGALLAILDRLDENSLREQRKLTIPFVKSVMAW
ncbi:DnaA regulatory inactivator Hda [Marinobacter caseinilyticus]|uniref:DnaA regulatory inactivator Hda n=1 Tax=Marinobacter caseinilyticus TaxID=2692195 RepID=UPI00140C3A4E|nr:DnaA regulatory inactivator Hda [Marinobacter caseinilyticus]